MALPVLAQLQLGSPAAAVRLAAAEELSKSGSAEASTLLHRALAREKDAGVREALQLAVARVDLAGTETTARLAALDVIGKSGNDGFLSELQRLIAKGPDGTPVETDAGVRRRRSRRATPSRATSAWSAFGGSVLHGLSLASVLLFAALGLAITFGLLGVINMAHGEMLMLGAYSTYTVQTLMHGHRFYLLVGDSGRLPGHGSDRRRASSAA